MPLTLHPSDLVGYWRDWVNHADQSGLGFEEVLYGDQTNILRVPTVCIEPGQITRELAGATLRTDNNFDLVFIVYNTGIGDIQAVQEATDVLTENLVDALNLESKTSRLGGLVVMGYVTSIEYGYAMRNNQLMRANRITWHAISKTDLV